MKMPSNIVECDDTCIIYPRKKSLIIVIILDILVQIVMFFVALALMNAAKKNGWIWMIGYIVIFLNATNEIVDAARLLKKPRPIILTKQDVTLNNGKKAKWKDIGGMYAKSSRYNFPLLKLYDSKGWDWSHIDNWSWYASKQLMIVLFEKYSGRKLYDSDWRHDLRFNHK